MRADLTPSILLSGVWAPSIGTASYDKTAPATREPLGSFPLSPWSELDRALDAGVAAFAEVRDTDPAELARFLEGMAGLIERDADRLAEVAHQETALPLAPRLRDVELARATGQLRDAARSAVDRTWTQPTLSPEQRIASYLAPIPGPIVVFGPNNFPFAFNSVSGGDFAAAVATRHPVIAVANPGHPNTTALLGGLAAEALAATTLPAALVQLVYGMAREDGLRLVGDQRIAATAYTGSRRSGLALKEQADRAGKPIYLELSSVNPVLVLEGALVERSEEIADALADSALLGGGQFCTSPGLLFAPSTDAGERFVAALTTRLTGSPAATLLDDRGREHLEETYETWHSAGAELVGRSDHETSWCRYPNTVMSVGASQFIAEAKALQTEAFGSMVLVVRFDDVDELAECARSLEGSLTGSIFSSTSGEDDDAVDHVGPILRDRVGRLLNDKVPTGVAVVPAMNHGGPFPSTGHPGFTAVGAPASLRRFGMLQCFDSVRVSRLPVELQPDNPLGVERFVDGSWTTAPTGWG